MPEILKADEREKVAFIAESLKKIPDSSVGFIFGYLSALVAAKGEKS